MSNPLCDIAGKLIYGSVTGFLPQELELHEWRNEGNDKGILQMAARRVLVEPVFILTAILTAVETVIRTFLSLIFVGTGCLIPRGECSRWYYDTIIEPAITSAVDNFYISTVLFTWTVTNIYHETLDPFEAGINCRN